MINTDNAIKMAYDLVKKGLISEQIYIMFQNEMDTIIQKHKDLMRDIEIAFELIEV